MSVASSSCCEANWAPTADEFTICANVRRETGETTNCVVFGCCEPSCKWSVEIGTVLAFSCEDAAPDHDSSNQDAGVNSGIGGPEYNTRDVGATTLDDGEWHHVSVTHSAGFVRCFVNGRFDGETQTKVPAKLGRGMYFGDAASEGAETVKEGLISNLRVYAGALAEPQIAGIVSKSLQLPCGIGLVMTPADVRVFWGSYVDSVTSDVTDPDGARSSIDRALGLGHIGDRRFQDDVVCLFFIDLLAHCHKMCLWPAKAAVFVAIMSGIFSLMHQRSKTTVRVGERMSTSECFLEYRRLILAHAGGPPTAENYALNVFTMPDIQQLTEFVSSTFFEHFILYQNVLVCHQESQVKQVEVFFRYPRCPPDLADATDRTTKK